MIKEKLRTVPSGWLALGVLVPLLVFTVLVFIRGLAQQDVTVILFSSFLMTAAIICLVGLFMVEPNQERVLLLFGNYMGTVLEPGLRWANPFYTKRAVSLRVRNFETERSKVNDTDGNPIEISAVVVWRVIDTAEATFEVDDFENYVHVQSESAVRDLATRYPYDTHEDDAVSLRGHTLAIAEQLKEEIQARLDTAGVETIDRITHLTYAAEIASAMLQRQQAGAIIAARTRIVEGAVGMVEMALEKLSSQRIIDLDEDRKASMVSNLLVVLCGDRGTQPVVNAGTIYQ